TSDTSGAIRLLPENDSVLVDELLKTVGLGSDAALLLKLQKSYDVTTLSRSLAENYAKVTGRGDVKALLEGEAYPKFAADRQLIDLFEDYPEKLTADHFTGVRPAPPPRPEHVAFHLHASSPRLLRRSRRIRARRSSWLGRCAGNHTARCARASRPPISASGAR